MKGRIKRLRVKNLLSLRDITIDFGEKLTVLVGPNAGGKSNIIKALRLIRGEYSYTSQKEIAYGGGKSDIHIKLSIEIGDEEFKPAHYQYTLSFKGGIFEGFDPPELRDDIVEFIGDFHFYSFNPDAMRGNFPMVTKLKLSRDGSNLAGLLAYIKLTDYQLFHTIEESLENYIPEVEEIVLKPIEMRGEREKFYKLMIRERGFKEAFTEIADGTLRILGFITALSLKSSFIAFEEPENCIHPHLLELLVDMMRKADCQVVITTHSPYLLDYVEPEEVVVVWREMGEEGLETKVRRPSEEELERVRKLLREGWTLGEVWYSGELGGVPE